MIKIRKATSPLFQLRPERRDTLKNSIDHFMTTISRQWADPATRFFRLKQEWEEVTAMLSSITEIAMHPAYQQIIGMGSIAIPFIMRELENRPAHWFWALKSITGEDPVPPEKRGRIGDMTKAWLSWGREHDYIR
ncbi:MAG: hypothetical protein L6263_00940 [Desulfobacteraceae bacterium]|nr:hypothetical protein [Desulfobacteraceae bacterium]